MTGKLNACLEKEAYALKDRKMRKILEIFCSVITVASALIPVLRFDFFNAPEYLNLLQYSRPLGLMVLIGGTVSGVFCFFEKYIFCLIAGVVSLGCVVAFHLSLSKMLQSAGMIEITRFFVKLRPGYFVWLVGTLGLVAVGIVGIVKRSDS